MTRIQEFSSLKSLFKKLSNMYRCVLCAIFVVVFFSCVHDAAENSKQLFCFSLQL